MHINWRALIIKTLLWTAVMLLVFLFLFAIAIVVGFLFFKGDGSVTLLNGMVFVVAPLMWLAGVMWIVKDELSEY